MELCYRNNPKSLFRKYALFVTSLTRHQLFRDYISKEGFYIPKETVLLLPNGFSEYLGQEKKRHYFQTTVSTRPIFAPKLYPALYYLDAAAPFLRTLEEAERFFLGQLGLLKPREHWSRYQEILKWFPHYATVTTVYPDPSVEVATVDGYARRSGIDESLATIRAGAGTASGDADTNIDQRIEGSVTSNQFRLLDRMFYLFDASSIPDTDDISAGTLSPFGATSKATGLGSPDYHIAGSTPASNTAIVNADYSQVQTTSFGSIANASWNTAAYNDITLNADGRANISKTGISKFSGQFNWDINNDFTGAWVSEAVSNFGIYLADQAETTNDPKLTVTHAAPGGGDDWPVSGMGGFRSWRF